MALLPRLARSRFIVLAVLVTILTFLWTFAVPRDLPEPVLPVVNNGRPQAAPEKLEKAPTASASSSVLKQTTSFAAAIVPTSTRITTSTTRISHENPTSSVTPARQKESSTPAQQAHKHDSANTTLAEVAPPPYPTAKNGTMLANTTVAETHCRGIPGASNILIIVKTSKAEIESKLPTQLDTLLSCALNFAIFSDHAGLVRNHTIYDALEGVTSAAKAQHDDFKNYEKMRTQPKAKVTIPKSLDKWKMLPMIYKAYKMHPNTRFFVVIEPDTSLSWTNLLQWTSRLDYRIPYYAGAPIAAGALKFVQGGPGMLLSNAALAQFAKAYDEMYASEWEDRVAKEDSGDVVLATAMADAHVELYGAYPMLQPNSPSSFGWTEQTWCVPSVSWQHMPASAVEEAWQAEKNFTREHGWKSPYLMRDAFSALIFPHLVDHKDEWDNGAQDTSIVKPLLDDLSEQDSQDWYKFDADIRQAVTSAENCMKVCELAADCHQWRYTAKGEGECHLGKTIRFGRKVVKKEGEEGWISGWVVERVRDTTRDWKCEKVKWGFNQ